MSRLLDDDKFATATERLQERFSRALDLMAEGRHHAARQEMVGFDAAVTKLAQRSEHGSPPLEPEVSIVVLSHPPVDGLTDALQAIARQLPTSAEVVLVDNGNDALFDTAVATLEHFVL